MVDNELVEQLKKSKSIVGEQSAIVVDFDGEVLSGRHRKEASWEKTESIDTKVIAEKLGVSVAIAKEVVRTHFNLQRKPSREETQESLLKIAKELEVKGILKENIAGEVAKLVPYSSAWVSELLPIEYKQFEKVEAGKKAAQLLELDKRKGAKVLSQKVEAEEKPSQHPVQCSNCPNGTWYPKTWEGKIVCPPCYDKLERGEITLEKTTIPVVKTEPTIIKPKDTWEHRKAVMSTPVSKMELSVLEKLEQKGVHPEIQKEFCLQHTRPDYYFPQQNVAIYLDGVVHRGREDRDEAIRELLIKRHNVKVVSIRYEGSSEETEDSIVKQIMEAIVEKAI